MLRAIILADDLSGAADCGAAFSRAGLSTIVTLGGAPGKADAEVFSVDANTRHLPAEAAAAAVRALVLQHAAPRDLLFFKKIDSTLRGHVGVELAAALAAYRSLHPDLNPPVAVCAPAFPSIGRTTVNGIQWMHGKPLHETEIWGLHGLAYPAMIPDILQAAGLRAALVPLDTIRSADDRLTKAMWAAASEADVLVCDAEHDTDLQAIADASLQLERKILFVGSAGLAYPLLRAAGFGCVPIMARKHRMPVSGSLLFVVGSLSRRSLEQVQVLTSSSPVLRVSVPPDILLSGEASMAWRQYERQVEQAIARGADVVLGPGAELQIEMIDGPRLTASLARMTASVRHRVGALIGSGGETARSVLQCWEVAGLRLLGELETGVPVSVTEGWSRQLPVITKAGDFGKPETLLDCRRWLHGTEG